MAELPLSIYDDSVLRRMAEPIDRVDEHVRALARAMAETMYAGRGIGLAANQVGRTERIIVVDVDWPAREDEGVYTRRPTAMINPEVVEESADDDVMEEGCLSLPGIRGDVWRPKQIRYRYLDLHGEPREQEASGLLARCIQHEIDHLDGTLFIDRMATEERRRLAGQLAALRRSRAAAAG